MATGTYGGLILPFQPWPGRRHFSTKAVLPSRRLDLTCCPTRGEYNKSYAAGYKSLTCASGSL